MIKDLVEESLALLVSMRSPEDRITFYRSVVKEKR